MTSFKRVAYHLVRLIFVSVGSIFVLAGSLLVIIIAIIGIDNLIFLSKAESVKGTIIEFVPKPNDRIERSYLKIEFREKNTKRRIEFISSISFRPKAYNVDDKIKVFYDPENPEDAETGTDELLLGGAVLLIPAAFLFAIGFYFRKTGRKIVRPEKM